MFMYSILGLVSRSTVISLRLTHFLPLSARFYICQFTYGCFIFTVVSAAALLTVGSISPWWFLIAFLPVTIMESAARPFSTAILLDQQKTDIGSASSLINAVNTVFGSLGMMLGALNWSNFIEGLGIITAVCVTLAIYKNWSK